MKIGSDRDVPLSACTSCGHKMDVANNVSEDGDAPPEPGAFTICIRCGHIQAFADDMSLRELSNEEMVEVAGDKRIIAVQRARASVERDRAYCEDFVRECVRKFNQPMPPDWQINFVVDKILRGVPPPPRKPR